MRLLQSWLLPAFITAASAVSDASVYLLQANDVPKSSNPPSLSPEQARLVFAQRLGASKYHSLKDADAATLSYINKFGGQHAALFEQSVRKAAELVLIVDGVSSQVEEPLLEAWSSVKPAFFISSPPSMVANSKLVADLSQQIGEGKVCALEDDVNPFEGDCWNGKSKIVYYDLSKPFHTVAKLVDAQKRVISLAKHEAMNVLVVLMPTSSISSKAKDSYGSYEMPTQASLGRRHVEEPMNEAPVSAPANPNRSPSTLSNSAFKPITGVPAVCHSSLDSCTKKTNECSGHGKCFKKRGTVGKDACFTCGCVPYKETFIHGPENRTGVRIAYWGGAACQKRDVSGPFWLIAIFTVVMVGLVSYSIGLMYSIGEEKLPGVIGAGVSTNRAR